MNYGFVLIGFPSMCVSLNLPGLPGLTGISYFPYSRQPYVADSVVQYALPVRPSKTTTREPSCLCEYLSGLVRLYRRIAAKMAATLSLNCVLVMQGR